MAAVAHLSAYHFARQFKATTGLPPHQYVITRRVECAKQLLQQDDDHPLAEIAARRIFGPKPVLPSLQTLRRVHTEPISQIRKNRIKDRKSPPEPGPRAL